ncbi:class I SAM-dependent methyltransferase [Nitrosophilus kaiyonis]|uniref:class I SAM-dependent methyltransferase n=1 Tax=Nitrosophilus kaiyonis TaxID=2930200 RepID=UPI0024928D2D|nr:class I SAM-dependent methyltransferase [Nitrosophilus kaiyonis]
MSKEAIFDQNFEYYDKWFDEHYKIYEIELNAIKKLLPPFKDGLEVGVGTGRFAAPLGIKYGIEPSKNMAKIAKKRGIKVINAVAENLPFEDKSFDLILIVTTICFVKDPLKMLKESYRVLKDNGKIIIAFVDKNSELGKFYEKNRDKSKFYKEATFFSKKEVFSLLKRSGFVLEACNESLFGPDLEHLELKTTQGCKKGGAFLVLRARKKEFK